MKMKFFRIRVKLLMSGKEKLIEPSSEASATVRNLIEGLQNYPKKKVLQFSAMKMETYYVP